MDVNETCNEEYPGPCYANWIRISKQKLKERERNLVTVKLNQIEHTVNGTLRVCDSCSSHKFTISEGTRCMIMAELFNAIDSWRGNSLKRIKKSPSSFRAYFKTGKNRWDSAKTTNLATALWIRIFSIINQTIARSSSTAKPRMFLLVLRDLLAAKVRYQNTRPQPLINSAVVRHQEIRSFLAQLHPSLKIEKRKSECATTEIGRIRDELQRILSNPDQSVESVPHVHGSGTSKIGGNADVETIPPPSVECNLQNALLNGNNQAVSAPAETLTSHRWLCGNNVMPITRSSGIYNSHNLPISTSSTSTTSISAFPTSSCTHILPTAHRQPVAAPPPIGSQWQSGNRGLSLGNQSTFSIQNEGTNTTNPYTATNGLVSIVPMVSIHGGAHLNQLIQPISVNQPQFIIIPSPQIQNHGGHIPMGINGYYPIHSTVQPVQLNRYSPYGVHPQIFNISC